MSYTVYLKAEIMEQRNISNTRFPSFSFFVPLPTILLFSKRLVSAVAEEDPLTIQVARGTNVYERHESTIVDVCNGAGASDKEVEECVVDFISGGYNYEADAVESDAVECNDEDADCLIDDMMNLWADELPPPSTTSGITAQTVQTTSKPKPWSSRSSPSGTWVRDPKTGKMRNIDA